MKNRLQSRREFFKEASEKALPILGMALLASTPILNSCTKEPDPSECNGCSNNCEGNNTSSGCSSCSDNCSSECTNDCSVNCSNSANNSAPEIISPASGEIDGYEYVDLGLSVMWARCNYHASEPHKFGARINWGNMSTDVNGPNALWTTMDLLGHNYSGFSTAGTQYDRCRINMGDSWSTPTNSQLNELFQQCTQEWIEIEGTQGVKLTSRRNNKSIFLPASGRSTKTSSGWNTSDENIKGYYWSANLAYLGSHPNIYAYYQLFSETQSSLYESLINNVHMHIRPVTSGNGGSTSCNNSCTNTATNGCGSQCASNCSTGCKTTCSGTCPNGCSTLCGGACKSSCGGTCSYVSSGSSCTSGTCATTCRNYCFRTCSLACSENCMSCCITSAK